MAALKGLKVGSFHGVEVRVHASLLFLLFYIMLIASISFPMVVKQSGVDPSGVHGSGGVWALVFALALFLSVLLHEFGHVLMAQRLGVKVRSITLMMLGGVSEMGPLPDTPYAEFKVSIVGPLVSLGLAAALFFGRSITAVPDIILFCHWLGRVNLTLAIFNLLPAFPLDGGRVFRSLLAPRIGVVRATQGAVSLARVLSFIFIALGAFSFNILLLLVGFFIYASSQAELMMLKSRELLGGIKAGDVGLRVPVLSGRASLEEVSRTMIADSLTALPVRMEDGSSGVVTVAQINKVPRRLWHQVEAREIASISPRVLDVGENLQESLMDLASEGALPLQEGGQVVGLVRQQDLSDFLELRSLGASERDRSGRAA